jgi:hypothetical protein
MKNSFLFHFLADHKDIFILVYGIQVIYVVQLATANHKMWLLQSWLQDVKSKPRASHCKSSWTGYCPNYCKHIKKKVYLCRANKCQVVFPTTMLIMVQQMFESRNDIYSLSSTPNAHVCLCVCACTHTRKKKYGLRICSQHANINDHPLHMFLRKNCTEILINVYVLQSLNVCNV